MPELRNCKRCNRVFLYAAGMQVCQACLAEEERTFEKVSLFVREHPGAPLPKVAEDLDISIDLLLKYVREGRLQIIGSDGKSVNFCEKCGKELTLRDAKSGGRLCKNCEAGISSALGEMRKGLIDSIAAGQNQSAFLKDRSSRQGPAKK